MTARAFTWSDFTKGEASIFPYAKMPPQYSVLLQNCHVSDQGGISKNPGYSRINPTPVAETLTSGFEFRKTDGTTIKLTAGGGKIYKADAVTGELTAIKTGLNANGIVSFASLGNTCIMVNGYDAPLKFDGTTVSSLGGSPPATAFFVWVHKGRVWMLERTNKMLATHSALNNPEDYTTANNAGYIDFQFVLGKGDTLLQVSTFVDLLVFHLENHTVIYAGSNPTSEGDFSMVQKMEGVGVDGTGTVQALGTDLAFLHASGIKSLRQATSNGNLSNGDISDRINPTFRGEVAANTSKRYAVAHYPKKGWLLLLVADKVWIYSYAWKAWGRMVGADVKGMFAGSDGKVYFTGTGHIYQFDSGWTFDGTNPAMIWASAWLRFTSQGNICYPSELHLINQPSALTQVTIAARFDTNIAMPENDQSFIMSPGPSLMDQPVIGEWDQTFLMDYGNDLEPIRVPLFGAGKIMQLSFSNTSDKGPIEFNELLVIADVGGLYL